VENSRTTVLFNLNNNKYFTLNIMRLKILINVAKVVRHAP